MFSHKTFLFPMRQRCIVVVPAQLSCMELQLCLRQVHLTPIHCGMAFTVRCLICHCHLEEGFVGQQSHSSKVNHSTFVNTSSSRNCTMFTHNQLTKKKRKHNIYDKQQQLERITSAFCQQKKSHKICYLADGLKFVA